MSYPPISSQYVPNNVVFCLWAQATLDIFNQQIKNLSKCIKLFQNAIINQPFSPQSKEIIHYNIVLFLQEKIKYQTQAWKIERCLKKALTPMT